MYRTIDTKVWKDPWFADCGSAEKLLFFYFVTNDRSTACGAYEIRIQDMAYETGLTIEQVKTGLDALHPKIMWWPSLRVILIPNFYKHQRANSNDKFAVAAAKALVEFPQDVVDTLCSLYPELDQAVNALSCVEGYPPPSHPPPTPLAPYGDGGKETVTVTVTESVTEGETGAAKAAPPPPPAKEKKAKETSFPADFVVTEEMRAKVRKKHPDLDIDAATEEWELSMRANRTKYRYSDWESAWVLAMGRAETWAKERGGRTNGQRQQQNGGTGNKATDAALRNLQSIADRSAGLAARDVDNGRLLGSGKDTAGR